MDDEEEMNGKMRQRTIRLKEEIEILKKQIKMFDSFILDNPELKKVALEAYRKYRPVFANYVSPKIENFRPDNPYDQMVKLDLDKSALERDLKERKFFLEQNPYVEELFVKYMNAPQTSTSDIVSLVTFKRAKRKREHGEIDFNLSKME